MLEEVTVRAAERRRPSCSPARHSPAGMLDISSWTTRGVEDEERRAREKRTHDVGRLLGGAVLVDELCRRRPRVLERLERPVEERLGRVRLQERLLVAQEVELAELSGEELRTDLDERQLGSLSTRVREDERERKGRTEAMPVWLATMQPLTRGGGAVPSTRLLARTYGLGLVSATCINAGPQGMNDARPRSRMRTSDLCTCGRGRASDVSLALSSRSSKREGERGRTSVGSTSSPWMMFMIEM